MIVTSFVPRTRCTPGISALFHIIPFQKGTESKCKVCKKGIASCHNKYILFQ